MNFFKIVAPLLVGQAQSYFTHKIAGRKFVTIA